MTERIWDGKYDKDGRRVALPRIALPLQTVETVNDSAQQHQHARPPRGWPRLRVAQSPDLHGSHHLVGTKGHEDVDVAHKDRAANIWSENASMLTATDWRYLKLPRVELAKLQPSGFADLLVFAQTP